MLIIYDKNTGQVIESQTISEYPFGLPDATFLIAHISKTKSIPESQCGEFRIHDVEDAETVNKTLTHEYTIQNGKVVFGNERPIPEPEPRPTSEVDLLKQENKKLKEEDLNNKEAIAELYLLISGGF